MGDFLFYLALTVSLEVLKLWEVVFLTAQMMSLTALDVTALNRAGWKAGLS